MNTLEEPLFLRYFHDQLNLEIIPSATHLNTITDR